MAENKKMKTLNGYEIYDAVSRGRLTPVTANSDDGSVYTAVVEGVQNLYNGLSIIIIPSKTNTVATPTIDVNSLGAKQILLKLPATSDSAASGDVGWLVANYPVRITYNGTSFVADVIKVATDSSGAGSSGIDASAITTAVNNAINDLDMPNNYAAKNHTHDNYVSNNGGDINGGLNVNGILKVNNGQAFYYAVDPEDETKMTQTIGTNNATGTTICCSDDGLVDINGATTNIDGILKVKGQQAFNYSDSTTSQTIGTNNASGTTICCSNDGLVHINGAATDIGGVLKVKGQQAFNYSDATNSQTIGTNNATGGTTICCGDDGNVALNGTNTLTPNVLPRSNNTYNCGSVDYRWKGIYSNEAVNVSSDKRLKKYVKSLKHDEALNLINGIDVKTFKYKNDDDNKNRIGVLAQDMIELAPELSKLLVDEDSNGYYGVKTSDLVFPLIVAVQELSKQVEELNAKLQESTS